MSAAHARALGAALAVSSLIVVSGIGTAPAFARSTGDAARASRVAGDLPRPDDAGGSAGAARESGAKGEGDDERGVLDARIRRTWIGAIANDDVGTLARLLAHRSGEALVALRSANGKSALMVACKLGELALAKALVAAGADPDGRSATGGTPFMFAVLGDRLDVARWLHGEAGAALDARGSNGWSATTIAAAKGLDEMLDWLLEVGAPVDVADVYGFTPLMRAVDNAHERAARRLLDAGARTDAADERGNTTLHHAVAGGEAALVELLLDRGADPALANRDGLTPAALATARHAPSGERAGRDLPDRTLARLAAAADAAASPDGTSR